MKRLFVGLIVIMFLLAFQAVVLGIEHDPIGPKTPTPVPSGSSDTSPIEWGALGVIGGIIAGIYGFIRVIIGIFRRIFPSNR